MIGVIKYKDKSLNAMCLWMLDNNIDYQIIDPDDIFMHDDLCRYSKILYDTHNKDHNAIKKFNLSERKHILLNVECDITYVTDLGSEGLDKNKIVVFMDNVDSHISNHIKNIILPNQYIENLIIFNWQQKHPQNAGWIDYKDKVEFLQKYSKCLISHRGFFSAEANLCNVMYFDADQDIDTDRWTQQKKQPEYKTQTMSAKKYYEQYIIHN